MQNCSGSLRILFGVTLEQFCNIGQPNSGFLRQPSSCATGSLRLAFGISSAAAQNRWETASRFVRDFFDYSSTTLWERFDWPSTTLRQAVEQIPNQLDPCSEAVSKLSRVDPEQYRVDSQIQIEEQPKRRNKKSPLQTARRIKLEYDDG